jgi:hypothetical protein
VSQPETASSGGSRGAVVACSRTVDVYGFGTAIDITERKLADGLE